jgi:hypothetical protein
MICGAARVRFAETGLDERAFHARLGATRAVVAEVVAVGPPFNDRDPTLFGFARDFVKLALQ